ncbi:MAG TPA: cupin domain-containing protein [Methylococcaceae bacterium]|nr:cupin domain-containing protein [Methylococcaceae bacterium]
MHTDTVADQYTGTRQAEGQMKETIQRINLGAEFYTPEKCYIIELSSTPDDPDASIARARFARGVTTRWHRVVGTTERYVILEGSGRVEAGSLSPQDVSIADAVLIPLSCRQRIANLGQEDLIFLAICTPRFRPELYEDIEHNPLPRDGDVLAIIAPDPYKRASPVRRTGEFTR